jgi:hypothetical protein
VWLDTRLTKSYLSPRVYFASEFVQECVYDRFVRPNQARLMHRICGLAGDRLMGPMCGMLFEEHAHRRLCSGETFRVRPLHGPGGGSGDEDSTVCFGELDTLTVSYAADIRAGYYCRPHAQNFESVDAVIAPSSLFQITVGSQHPIKQHGLDQLQSRLSASGPIGLYFVVPPDRYRSFQAQSYVTQKGGLALL